LLERFVEGVALAPVEIQNRHILRHPAQRGGDHALRNARGLGLRRHARHEGVEVAAAAGGVGGRGDNKCAEEGDPPEIGAMKNDHTKSHTSCCNRIAWGL
jgi:hypothetical protein